MNPSDLPPGLPPDQITPLIQDGYQHFIEENNGDATKYTELVNEQSIATLKSLGRCTRNSFYLSLYQFQSRPFRQTALERFMLCATLGIIRSVDQVVKIDVDVDNTIRTYSLLITILGNHEEQQQQVVDFLMLPYPTTFGDCGARISSYRRLEQIVLLLFRDNQGALALPNPGSMILLRLAYIILYEQDQTLYDSSGYEIKAYITMKLYSEDRVIYHVYYHHTPDRTKAFIFLFILMQSDFYNFVYHGQVIPIPDWLKIDIFDELVSMTPHEFFHNHETLYGFIEKRVTQPDSPYLHALVNVNLLMAHPPHPPPHPPLHPPPHPPPNGGGNKKSKKRKRTLRKRKSNKHKMVQTKMQRKKSRHLYR
jgi:hypothetical protein